MADAVFVVLTVAFFAAAAFVLKGVERLVSGENWIGLIAGVLLVGYLLAALLFPERF